MSGAQLTDRRRHHFYVLDNELIDDYIERIPESRRADALAVYSVLARHADSNGVAWPGVAYIGRKIGRSRPTVIDAVKELGRVGLVGKEERPGDAGGQKTNVYTLPPVEKGGKGSGVNRIDTGRCKQDLGGGVNTVDTKKTQREEDVSANAESGIAKSADSADVDLTEEANAIEAMQTTRYEAQQSRRTAEPAAAPVIGLEKHVVDRMYAAMDKAGYTLDNGETFKYHLGRAKHMLEKMDPTDDELDFLPAACVAEFEIRAKTDPMSGLRYMRQQKARRKRIEEDGEGPSFYDKQENAAKEDRPRPAVWYASFYEVDYETVEGWVKEGLKHSEIVARFESGVVA